MFEREVKFIYDFNSTKVKKLGTTASYNDLLPLNIHPAILRYISAEIEYRVFEDRQTLLKHSMFDYSGAEITKHFQNITEVIKKEKKFSTDFLSKVILHATSFNVNYLIRPNWSLKKLIFETNESNSITEINQILNYTYFYKHIPKVIREYFEKKKLITMDKSQFEELLVKIDKVSFDSYGKDMLNSAIKSIASFFNIGSMKKTTVPLQAIGVFLQEKKLTDHLAKLEERLKGETKTKIEANDLRSILFEVPIEKTETISFTGKTEDEVQLEDEEVIESKPEFDSEIETEEIESVEELQEEPEPEIETSEPEKEFEPDVDEDDVEIKLRANKEKEIAEVEEESSEPEEMDEEETDEIDTYRSKEIDDEGDYLVDQTQENPDIILTAEDQQEIYEEEEPEEDSHTLEVKEEEEYQFEEELPEEDEEIFEEETEEEVTEIPKTELDSVEDEVIFEEDEQNIEEESEYEPEEETFEVYSYPDKNKEILHPDDFEEEIPTEEESKESVEDEEAIFPEASLFGEVDEEESSEEKTEKEEFISDYGSQTHAKKIDIADLLENKNMTKIIAVVFDYDMEDFANSIERICESSTSQEAFATLQEIYELNDVNPSSKEAQAFKEIISEYFEQN